MFSFSRIATVAFLPIRVLAIVALAACGADRPTPARSEPPAEPDSILARPDRAAVCRSCKLIAEPLFYVGRAAHETGGITEWSEMNWGADGRLYVSSPAEAGTIEVYDSTGLRVQVIGRKGEGPGELRAATAASAFADGTIVVVDRMRQRPLQIFDKHGRFLRSVGSAAVANVSFIRPLRDGSLLLYTSALQGDSILSLAVLRGDSVTPLASIPQLPAGTLAFGDGEVAATQTSDGTVWMTPRRRFELMTTGRDAEVWHRDLPGVESGGQFVRLDFLDVVDEYMVAVTNMRNPDYEDPIGHPPTKPLPVASVHWKVDQLVEVLNPQTRDLIVAGVYPRSIKGTLGNGRFYSIEEDKEGALYLRVWRLRIQT